MLLAAIHSLYELLHIVKEIPEPHSLHILLELYTDSAVFGSDEESST